jgi:hypothetical protein
MSDEPRTPLPPAELARKSPLLRVIQPTQGLLRLHDARFDARCFGPAPGSPPAGRFDPPEGAYRTCYAGLSLEACFVEKLCRTELRVLSLARCAALSIARLGPSRPLRLVELFGAGLSAVGATADVAHGRYRFSRAWGAALWAHPVQPDGIVWRSRLDDDQFCVALFDRCREALTVQASEPLLADRPRFDALIERYRMAVIPDA